MTPEQPTNPVVMFNTLKRAPPDEPGYWTPPSIPEPPGLLGKAWNFAASAAAHVAAGMPQASEEEVASRFSICQACEHYDGKACRQCGCPIVREKAFVSKLSWANEKCPVGKWGPAQTAQTTNSSEQKTVDP